MKKFAFLTIIFKGTFPGTFPRFSLPLIEKPVFIE